MELSRGHPLTRSLSNGAIDVLTIALRRGEFLKVIVRKKGIELSTRLIGPDGMAIEDIASPNGKGGPDVLVAIARIAGEYRVEVRASPVVRSGQYEILLAERRIAEPNDAVRVSATRALEEAWKLSGSEKAQNVRGARRLFERSLRLFRSVGDREETTAALVGLASALAAQGEHERALESCRQALEIARLLGDHELEALVLDEFGYVETLRGDAQKVVDYASQALALLRASGSRQLEPKTIDIMGWAYSNLGEYERTLELCGRGREMSHDAGQRWEEGWALACVGKARWLLGDADRAIDAFQGALPLMRATSETRGETVVLQSLGVAHAARGEPSQAIASLEAGLRLARSRRDSYDEAAELDGIGQILLSIGDRRGALAHFEQAHALAKSVGALLLEARFLSHVAEVHAAAGSTMQALGKYAQALNIQRAIGDRAGESRTQAAIAGIYRDTGDLDKALTLLDESLRIVESIRTSVSSEDLRSSYLASQQDAFRLYIEILMQLHDRFPSQGYDARAFQASERARARSLIESMVEARINPGDNLPVDLRQRDAAISARISRLQSEWSSSGTRRAQKEAELAKAEEEWERLLVEIRHRSPRYASIRYPEPISIDQTRTRLDSATAIVSYVHTAARTFVFVISREGLYVETLLGKPRELEERAADYADLLSRDEGSRWKAFGAQLYGQLIEPWRHRLPEAIRRLVIIPDGALNALPFEALVNPTTGHYFLQEFAISYAPSLTAQAELTAPPALEPTAQSADLFALANPTLPTALGGDTTAHDSTSAAWGVLVAEGFRIPAIPWAVREVKAIARYAGDGSVVLTGDQATEQRVKSEHLERFRVLHFATHGLISQRVPGRSALVLARRQGDREDGLLQVREIYRLKLGSELVVLSACQTARGRILPGEGVQGIAQAFFHAGARTLVASLWNVNDPGTAGLMESFYRHLAEGRSKAEALRAAKVDLLPKPGAGPRIWAAFVLIGEGNGAVPLHQRRWPWNNGLLLPAGLWLAFAASLLMKALGRATRRR